MARWSSDGNVVLCPDYQEETTSANESLMILILPKQLSSSDLPENIFAVYLFFVLLLLW